MPGGPDTEQLGDRNEKIHVGSAGRTKVCSVLGGPVRTIEELQGSVWALEGTAGKGELE